MTPIVECDGLARTYPTQPPVEALRPSSFVVHGGEQVMVCGPSGSGKSTLLNLLSLLDSPTSGSYQLQGVDTAGLAEAERATLRATAIGFVFQSFHLLGRRSATENVETGLLYLGIPRPTRIAKAREALDRVGLGHRADADVATLSGGERQRVAIARAIVNRPALLLADEPTGNLDSATSAQILAILDELTGDGHAQLVVTHNPEIAALGSRRFDVLDGAVTEAPAP